MSIKVIFPIIILLFLCLSVFAQDSEVFDQKPLWLRVDEAVQMVESGESGDAIYSFRKILEEYSGNPESAMWLGFIFAGENEYELAKRYLEKALTNKRQLNILEDQYTILYNLAEINQKMEDTASYVDNLTDIIAFSEEGLANKKLHNAMVKVLEERGFDKFIELYRPSGHISIDALGQLGKYYFKEELWSDAVDHLLQVTGSLITNAIEELKRIDTDYIYFIDESAEDDSSKTNTPTEKTDKPIERMLDDVNNHKILKKYFADNTFFEYFYYLGISLKKDGHIESGTYILNKIYIRPESGRWGALAYPF